MNPEKLAVTVEFGDVEVRVSAGPGDNHHRFTIDECRATLAEFEAAPPVLQPIVELRDALAEVIDVYDRSQTGAAIDGSAS
jgi:hypothetical protein